MIAFFTKVLVRTNSLLDALYTTARILVLRVMAKRKEARLDQSKRKYSLLTFATPAEVTGLQTQGAVLGVATSHSHRVDSVRAEPGHRRRATHLILSLFAMGMAFPTCSTALVARGPRDTHDRRRMREEEKRRARKQNCPQNTFFQKV